MAVLPILITGEPVLHARATDVTDFGEPLIRLVADMRETMEAAPGVGLAAPQVGVPLRVFVWEWTDDEGTESSGVAVNPELFITPVPAGEPDEEGESEGCLSVPGERFPLRRAATALLRARDLDGQPFEITAHGWLARIFQHEYDHLDGTLYVDRIGTEWAKPLAKTLRKKGWGKPGNSWLAGVDDLDA